MSHLVDTSALLGAGLPEADGDWSVSVVTVGELQAGVLCAGSPALRALRLRILGEVLDEAVVVGVDVSVASAYAEIRAAAGRQPSNDLWIAATAKAFDLELVTADRQLAKVPGVRTMLVG